MSERATAALALTLLGVGVGMVVASLWVLALDLSVDPLRLVCAHAGTARIPGTVVGRLCELRDCGRGL